MSEERQKQSERHAEEKSSRNGVLAQTEGKEDGREKGRQKKAGGSRLDESRVHS